MPLHVQIAEHFRNQIRGLFWPPNFKLKSEEHLASELGVARGTVRRAIQDLVKQGLLEQVQGKGTFVAGLGEMGFAARAAALSGPLLSNGEQLAKTGVFFEDKLLEYSISDGRVPAGTFSDEATAFHDVEVLYFKRLRSLREGPNSVIATEVSLGAVPGLRQLAPADLVAGSFHGLLGKKFSIVFSHAERIYSAMSANQELSVHLGVEVGTPLLIHDQYSYDNSGRCIEHSRAWTRTDRHLQTIVIKGLS